MFLFIVLGPRISVLYINTVIIERIVPTSRILSPVFNVPLRPAGLDSSTCLMKIPSMTVSPSPLTDMRPPSGQNQQHYTKCCCFEQRQSSGEHKLRNTKRYASEKLLVLCKRVFVRPCMWDFMQVCITLAIILY